MYQRLLFDLGCRIKGNELYIAWCYWNGSPRTIVEHSFHPNDLVLRKRCQIATKVYGKPTQIG